MTLGKRIKGLREALGLTPTELAKRAGIHRETILRLEAGVQRDVTLKIGTRIARGLGISFNALIENVDMDDDKEDEPTGKDVKSSLLVGT